MRHGKHKSRYGLEDDIAQVILLDHKQKHQNDKQQGTDGEPGIGFVVVHDVIGKRDSGQSCDEQPVDDRWVKTRGIGSHREVDQTRKNKQKRQCGNDKRQPQNLVDKPHHYYDAEDAVNHKSDDAVHKVHRGIGQEKKV